MMYHIPVLLDESISGLNIKADGTYADVTFGSGAHSARILQLLENGKLVAFDRDKDAAANAFQDDRFIFIRQNFRYLGNFLRFHGIQQIDGLIADLGVSSHQIDEPARGFSTRFPGELDMRMDQDQDIQASHILNLYSENDLARIFRDYGEIQEAGKIARDIVQARLICKLRSTEDLKAILVRYAPRNRENRFLARAFQAIRIEVNEEIESLKEMLWQGCDLLNPGGRIVIISYHSLEDRLVKNYFRTGNFEGQPIQDFFGRQISPIKPVNRKAISPSPGEIESNPRSRSAKLRIAEKLQNE